MSTTTQSNTFTVCISAKKFSRLHCIVLEMLKKTQHGCVTNCITKNC